MYRVYTQCAMCIFMTQGKIRRGSKQLLTPFANCLHWRWSHLYFCLFQYQVSYQLTQKLLFCKNWYLKNWAGENRKILKCLEFISNFDLTYNFCKCFSIYLKYRTYCVFRKKLICYIKFQVRIERVFDKNETNNTFKAQSSEFVQKTKLTLKCKNGWRLHLAHHCSTLSQVTFEERGGFLQL